MENQYRRKARRSGALSLTSSLTLERFFSYYGMQFYIFFAPGIAKNHNDACFVTHLLNLHLIGTIVPCKFLAKSLLYNGQILNFLF